MWSGALDDLSVSPLPPQWPAPPCLRHLTSAQPTVFDGPVLFFAPLRSFKTDAVLLPSSPLRWAGHFRLPTRLLDHVWLPTAASYRAHSSSPTSSRVSQKRRMSSRSPPKSAASKRNVRMWATRCRPRRACKHPPYKSENGGCHPPAVQTTRKPTLWTRCQAG